MRPTPEENSATTRSEPASDSFAESFPVQPTLRLALPKGSMQQGVFTLLNDAGIAIAVGQRGYRPTVSLPGVDTKLLKPQNIVEMLNRSSRDIGFAGADWVAELGATNVVEVLDTELDPVTIVAAMPSALAPDGRLPKRSIAVASEYERLTKKWIADHQLSATYVHAYGATEVFPPDDADCIIDNSATGSTLKANDLVVVDELMRSSTRLYASRAAIDDARRSAAIERIALLLESVLNARKRVMVELNVPADALERVIAALPALRQPTVSPLYHHEQGAQTKEAQGAFAIRSAIPRSDLARIIPELKSRGGTDIVVTQIAQIVP